MENQNSSNNPLNLNPSTQGKGKLVLIGLLVVIVIGGLGYFFKDAIGLKGSIRRGELDDVRVRRDYSQEDLERESPVDRSENYEFDFNVRAGDANPWVEEEIQEIQNQAAEEVKAKAEAEAKAKAEAEAKAKAEAEAKAKADKEKAEKEAYDNQPATNICGWWSEEEKALLVVLKNAESIYLSGETENQKKAALEAAKSEYNKKMAEISKKAENGELSTDEIEKQQDSVQNEYDDKVAKIKAKYDPLIEKIEEDYNTAMANYKDHFSKKGNCSYSPQ